MAKTYLYRLPLDCNPDGRYRCAALGCEKVAHYLVFYGSCMAKGDNNKCADSKAITTGKQYACEECFN
jgi:hypothetical protein